LTVYKSELIAGGNFGKAGETSARKRGTLERQLVGAARTGLNGQVRALIVCKGELIAGGTFTRSGGTTLNASLGGMARRGTPLGGGVSGTWSPGVYCLAVFGGDLYAGGLFLKAGDETVNHVAPDGMGPDGTRLPEG
jgi:hypothetical protein